MALSPFVRCVLLLVLVPADRCMCSVFTHSEGLAGNGDRLLRTAAQYAGASRAFSSKNVASSLLSMGETYESLATLHSDMADKVEYVFVKALAALGSVWDQQLVKTLHNLDREKNAPTKFAGEGNHDSEKNHVLHGAVLGVELPPFPAPFSMEKDFKFASAATPRNINNAVEIPYLYYHDANADKGAGGYKGGKFVMYVSAGPLSREKFEQIPCSDGSVYDSEHNGVALTQLHDRATQLAGKRGKSIDKKEVDKVHSHRVLVRTESDSSFASSRGIYGDPAENIAADAGKLNGTVKAMVMVLNFVQAGYWGHMMDNGFPRAAFLSEAARTAGYKLYIVIPQRQVVYSWGSLQQVREVARKLFDAELVVPGEPESPQLPSVCEAAESSLHEKRGACRFVAVCGMPSYHKIPRLRMQTLARQRVVEKLPVGQKAWGAAHVNLGLAWEDLTAIGASANENVYVDRGETHNDKGDVQFKQALFAAFRNLRPPAIGRWDIVNLGEASDASSTNRKSLMLEKLPLLAVASLFAHRKVMAGVEGSAMYHQLWMQPRGFGTTGGKMAMLINNATTGGKTEHHLADDQDRSGENTVVVEMLPHTRIDLCRWLWATVLGHTYYPVVFEKGERDVGGMLAVLTGVVGHAGSE